MSILLYLILCFENLRAETLILPEITVEAQKTATPPDSTQRVSGARLQRKKQNNIGESLKSESGVSASEFGPSASRPILRGLEGDRARILQNGSGVLDASTLSQDHAVAIDPLVVDQVEIVRGPKALLYGNQVIGGVINLKTNQIPEHLNNESEIEASGSTTDFSRTLSLSTDRQIQDHLEIHLDATGRAFENYHAAGTEIENSANRTASQTAGGSYVNDKGFFGISFSNYNSLYGTVVDPNGLITLLQQHVDFASSHKLDGLFDLLSIKNSFSHYTHDERDLNVTASRFNNDGDDLRLETHHQAIMNFGGTLGAEVAISRFAVVGEDKLIPESRTSKYSIFLFEESEAKIFKPSFALRFEQDQIQTNDDAAFGLGQKKSFGSSNVAVGFLYQLNSQNSFKTNIGYTERAPTYDELFAQGPHDATKQFEIGDQNLDLEKARSLELVWLFENDVYRFQTSVYVQDFFGFVSLAPTGQIDSASQLPKYQFNPVAARFYGGEFQARQKISPVYSLELKLDSVTAFDRSTSNSLPRIPPMREMLALLYNGDRYQADLEIVNVHPQNQNAPNESTTGGYALLNAGLNLPNKKFEVFVRLNNILDTLAHNHTSVIKDVAPLPGRNFSAGLRMDF